MPRLLIAFLLTLVLAGCGGIGTTPRLHAYEPTSTATTGSGAALLAAFRVYDPPIEVSRAHSAVAPAGSAAEDVLPTPEVEDPKLQNIVNDLYKGTTNPNAVGNGTTADAVRAETETGQPTGGVFHTAKAEQYSNALSKLLNGSNLSPSDQLVARSLLDDLQNALGNGS